MLDTKAFVGQFAVFVDTWARGSGPSLRHAKYILYVNISATKLCYVRLHFSLVNVSNPAIRLRCPSSSQRNHDVCPSGTKEGKV